MIYIVGAESAGVVKIGHCDRPDVTIRVAQIQGQSPIQVQLLTQAPGTRKDEWRLHAEFIAHRSHGEWFRAVPAILDLIEHLKLHGQLPDHLRGDPCQPNPFNGPHLAAKRRREARQGFWGAT